MPGRSNRTIREVPTSYRPRSNRFPSKSEKTLWKKGSRLGNSTTDPAGTTRMCGSKLLFFCTSRGFCAGLAGAPAEDSAATTVASPLAPITGSGVSHTTVPGIVPCRLLPLPVASMTSTRPRTVVVAARVVSCARNPAAPAHNIATQIKILLWLIVAGPSWFVVPCSLLRLLTLPFPSSCSKKNSHHQIQMPCAVPAVGKRNRRQVPILSGKQQIRSGTVNHVHKAPLISCQRRIPVGPRIREIFQIAGIRIIHPKRRIELPFIRGPVFQLHPAPERVQRLHFRAGQCRIAAEQHALSECTVQSTNRPSPIKLSAQRKLAAERQFNVRHSGPAIDVPIEAIILPRVVPSNSHPQRLSENIPRPCDSRAVRRLTRCFPRARLPVIT